MTVSGWRIALLALLGIALIVSALLGTSAYAHETSRSVSAVASHSCASTC